LLPLHPTDPGVDHGQFHIFLGAELGQQVKLLKYKANLLVANMGQGGIVQLGYILAIKKYSLAGAIQAANHIHGGRFTRPGGAQTAQYSPGQWSG
jgi:hypothetical protein